jgi:hypothetical protein
MVLLLPVMVAMLVMVVDIGQLVFERIRLQTTVDACALAAATVQSAGLNEIADLNREAYLEFRKARRILKSGTWFSYGTARRPIRFFARVLDSIHRYQDMANSYFAALALRAAENTRRLNLPSSRLVAVSGASNSRLARFSTENKGFSYRFYTASCDECAVPTKHWYYPDNPAFYGRHDGSYTLMTPRVASVSSYQTYKVRRRKINPPVTYAAFGLMQRTKGFILGNSSLGIRMPPLVAYAAAKPTGGDIYRMKPSYIPMMVQLKRLTPRPGVPDLARMEH